MDKFEEELKEILAQSKHKSSGAERFVRASLAENKYPKDFLVYFINSECFGDYESELPAYEAWQHQQAKVEELQRRNQMLNDNIKEQGQKLVYQNEVIETQAEKLLGLRDEKAELQKRVDAVVCELDCQIQCSISSHTQKMLIEIRQALNGECKHESDGSFLLSDPPRTKCKKCGEFYFKALKGEG